MPFENFKWKKLCAILHEPTSTNSNISLKSIRSERYDIFDDGGF